MRDTMHIQDLKLRYYELIIQLALHEDKYLDACKAYQEVWDTEEVKADPEKEKEVSLSRRLIETSLLKSNNYTPSGHREHYRLHRSGAVRQRATRHVEQALRQYQIAEMCSSLVSTATKLGFGASC